MHQFLNKERAIEGGRALATGAPGVAIFSVDGYPDIDLWDEPRMLESFGQVPAIDPAPPDDVDYFMIDCSDHGDAWTQIDPLEGVDLAEDAA
ncbi:hypothetical protein D3C72_2254120 [compost metagenome]